MNNTLDTYFLSQLNSQGEGQGGLLFGEPETVTTLLYCSINPMSTAQPFLWIREIRMRGTCDWREGTERAEEFKK